MQNKFRDIISFEPSYMSAKIPSDDIINEWTKFGDISALCPIIYYIGTGEHWKNILEIGTGPYAKSTITLAEIIKERGKLLTVDMVERHKEFVPVRDDIYFMCAKTREDDEKIIAKVMELDLLPLDCLFIDGDHTLNAISHDFNVYSKYVRKEGFILFHDINLSMKDHDGPQFWQENNFDGYEKIILSFNNGLGILRKLF